MANDMKYLSAEEEAKLLKPIDEYIGKIQKQIDALRKDGSDKVQELKTHISLVRENKNYTKEEQAEIIRKDKEQMVKAKETEAANKDKVSKLIAEAEEYLKAHFKKDYYDKVAASCAAQKEQENAEKAAGIRGEVTEIGWGNQIRSYVMQPYTMVKDHRTGVETGNVDSVMDGKIDLFINGYLKWLSLGCPKGLGGDDE